MSKTASDSQIKSEFTRDQKTWEKSVCQGERFNRKGRS